jgi:hypothetical protein
MAYSKPDKSLIEGPVEEVCGSIPKGGRATTGQGSSVYPKFPRSSNSGMPEKQFESYGKLPKDTIKDGSV